MISLWIGDHTDIGYAPQSNIGKLKLASPGQILLIIIVIVVEILYFVE